MAKVRAKLKLLNHQLKFVQSTAKFPGLIGGFGCGKTEALIFRCLSKCFHYGPLFKKHSGKQYVFGIYEPTYDLISTILIPRLEEILTIYKIEYELNKTDKVVYLTGLNCKLLLRTMENPEKIIGFETADAIMDEIDTLPEEKAEEVFTRVNSRNRQKKPDGEPNTCGVTTTPEGFRFCYKKWKLKDIKEPLQKEDFELIKGLTRNNIYLGDDYIATLESQYPAAKLKAYLEGEFVNFTGLTVYEDFDRYENKTEMKINEGMKLHIGMDFNVGKMSAVICVIINNDVFVLDEIFGVLDTPAMIKEILKRYRGYDITVYPDSSGKNRKSVNASETDIKLLKNHFKVLAHRKNPLVKNRVQSLQYMILNMAGIRRLFVNVKKCKNLVENLEQQIYDKNGEPDKKCGQDHMLDALGYFVYWHFGVNRKVARVKKNRHFV